MVRRLVILGTGGNVQDILDVVDAINRQQVIWEIVGYLDDVRPAGDRHLNYPVLGPIQEARRLEDCYFINSIGSDNSYKRRENIIKSTGLPDELFATLIHPFASVSSRATLGHASM